MTNRIIGIDLARALSVIGMIIVNFKMVIGQEGSSWLKDISSIFDGKAAATFVVLAGIGIAFMTKSASKENSPDKWKKAQTKIIKRAVFLFIIGLSYLFIWPADILHFYGIYMLVTLFFIKKNPNLAFFSGIFMIIIYPVLMFIFPYDSNWDFITLSYQNFWTPEGFFSNLFYNGFHPVVPWSAFMLIGFWFGRQDLNNKSFVKKASWFSGLSFLILKIISISSIYLLSEGDQNSANELSQILGTSPMPPLPIYMFSGSSIAIFIIANSILIADKFKTNLIVTTLVKTGQLALTFYVAHVIIGMGLVEVFSDKKLGSHSLEFSISYALIFSLICVFFAVFLEKLNKPGPLEWFMRKVTD